MEDEYFGRKAGAKARGTSMRAFLPLIGFIFIGILGVFAFILSEPVNTLLSERMANYPYDQMETMRIVVGVVIFFVGLLFLGMLYAMFAPKPPKTVTERELEKEKRAKQQELLAKKRRKREIQKKMAQDAKARRGEK
ncbi:MAG: hypothetical protein D6712_12140 [Chloroflexi bacterium]|nr:MAG: hypothetical protein D6712_12140 [Chloroflexota bacterium]